MNSTEYDLRGAVAYSYARFSDPTQAAGHSLERQKDYAPEFCKEFGCKLDPTLSFQDEGKSAFHGRHILEGGGLGRFVACIQAGRVKPGDVLIVENLDRVSRLPLERAEDLLGSILKQGVRIHTRSPWALYDRGTLNDPMQRMQMIFEFTRSHRESKYKQERLTRRWIQNRARIKEGEYHLAKIPGWLVPVRQKNKIVGYEIDQQLANVVRLIFRLSVDGVGLTGIVKKLNVDGVPTFGAAKLWARSSVAKILKNRAVLGEYQPHSKVKIDGREIVSTKRVAVGEPVKNHFPRIVSDKEFNDAQLAISKRKNSPTGSGSSDKVTNLFAGMLVDARTGSSMYVVNKGFGPQIVAGEAYTGIGKAAYVPYEILENAFVVFVNKMPLDMVFPKDESNLEKQIGEARKAIESLTLQVAKIKAKTRENTSDALLELLVERDHELKQATIDLETLERQRGTAATVAASTTKEILKTLSTTKGEKLHSLRTRLRNELRYWITRVTLLPLKLGSVKAAIVDVELKNGEHLKFRVSDDLVEWPKELEGRDILKFAKWPESLRNASWDAITIEDRKLLELHAKGLSLREIAEQSGMPLSTISKRLTKHGKRRMTRGKLGKDREMTWVAGANGWQRYKDGERFYVGCGTLKRLYPRLVTSMDEAGSIKAANRWWNEHGK